MLYEKEKDELFRLLKSKGFKETPTEMTRLEWDVILDIPEFIGYMAFSYCRYDESILFVGKSECRTVSYHFTFHKYGYIHDDKDKAEMVLAHSLGLMESITSHEVAGNIRKQLYSK